MTSAQAIHTTKNGASLWGHAVRIEPKKPSWLNRFFGSNPALHLAKRHHYPLSGVVDRLGLSYYTGLNVLRWL
jgi:hypothetical protein